MKKIIFLVLLLLMVSFVGCGNTADTDTSSIQIVVVPDNDTRNSLNGYRDPSKPFYIPEDKKDATDDKKTNPNLTRENAPYFGNVSSKKYHIFDCTYAVNIRDNNLALFATAAEAENSGYDPCQKCLKYQ